MLSKVQVLFLVKYNIGPLAANNVTLITVTIEVRQCIIAILDTGAFLDYVIRSLLAHRAQANLCSGNKN